MDSTIFALVLIAAMLHALWNFAARKASGDLAVIWFGLIVTGLGSLPFAMNIELTGESLRSAWPYMVATGIIHAFYFGLLSSSYKEGEISVVYPIARGSGVAGTSLAAPIFISEEISPEGVVGITAISFGILALGLQGSDLKKQFRSGIFALLVGCTIVGYSLVDKVGVGRIHPVFYIFCLFSFAAFFLSPYVLLTCGKACVNVWKNMKRYIFLIGPGSMLTYLIILFALQSGKVSYIVATREFAVVIGSALGIAFLGERLTWRKCLGISAITLGLVLVKVTK
jgi:uncharacterized membrane protein